MLMLNKRFLPAENTVRITNRLTALDSVEKVDLSSAPIISLNTSNFSDRAGSCGSTEVPSPSIPGKYKSTGLSPSTFEPFAPPPAAEGDSGASVFFQRSKLTPRMSITSGRSSGRGKDGGSGGPGGGIYQFFYPRMHTNKQYKHQIFLLFGYIRVSRPF